PTLAWPGKGRCSLISLAHDGTVWADASGPVYSGGAPNSTGASNNSGSRNGNGPAHNRSPVGADASGSQNPSTANDSVSGWAQSEPNECQHGGQRDAFHPLEASQPHTRPTTNASDSRRSSAAPARRRRAADSRHR